MDGLSPASSVAALALVSPAAEAEADDVDAGADVDVADAADDLVRHFGTESPGKKKSVDQESH